MIIINIVNRLQDTKIIVKNVLVIIGLLQSVFLGSVILDWLGFEIPFLRQIFGFLYLTFIPGLLLLGVLKINNLSTTETILYSIGLSILFIIVLGTLTNFVYPLLGFNLFREHEIIITFIIAISILSLIFWKYGSKKDIRISINFPLPYLLSFLLLPILTALGVYLLQYFKNNHLLLLLFLCISIIPLIFTFKELPKNSYPLAIWTITLSLVFYNSLFGCYMHLTDNASEFYFIQKILQNGIWDISIPSNINAMAGVMVTIPTYSLVSGLDLVWIYKIIVPFLSSFIPLTLFKAYENKFGRKIAFLSSFFFLSMFNFFTWSSITMKMVLSMIFLSLLVLLITNNNIDIRHKNYLGICSIFGIIMSHYGTASILSLIFIIFLILLLIGNKLKILDKYTRIEFINPSFIVFYIFFMLSLYNYVGKGVIFNSLTDIGSRIVYNIITIFQYPKEIYTIEILLTRLPSYLDIIKYLYIISYGLMCLSMFLILRKNSEEIMIDTYVLLSFSSLFMLLMLHVVPGTQYGGGRAWTILGCFLAPFVIISCIKFSKFLKKFFPSIKNEMMIASSFLCVFFLFNSGFLAEIVWNYNVGPSAYISAPRIMEKGTIEEKEYLYRVQLSVLDLESAEWLGKKGSDENYRIFMDGRGVQPLSVVGLQTLNIGKYARENLYKNTRIPEKSYVYLTEFNVKTGLIRHPPWVEHFFFDTFNITDIHQFFNLTNKIYTNSGSEIYYR